jgi:DNA-binding XRE family transcriptional regulator
MAAGSQRIIAKFCEATSSLSISKHAPGSVWLGMQTTRSPLDAARATLARNVRMLRAARRPSQMTLAQDAGITPALISAIESCKANPTMDSLQRIAEALGIEMAVLFVEREQR